MKIFLAIVLACATLLGLGLWSESPLGWALAAVAGSANKQNAGDRYRTTTVALGEIRQTITAAGTLQAVANVEVSSQLSGQIAELNADFNQEVAAGQTLAVLDQRGFRAHVVKAEAEGAMARENVAILRAKLEKAQGGEREAFARRKIFAAKIDQARVKLAAAKQKLQRTEKLAGRGTAAKAVLEDAVTARDAAAAELREAKAVAEAHSHVVASSEAGRREAEAELANAKAALPLREAEVTLAQLDLERSTIRAPIDGVVVGRNVELGQTVAATLDAPILFNIAGDLSAMVIHANIDETDIAEIAVDQRAAFTVDAFPDRRFTAKVTEIRKAAVVVQGVVAYTVVLEASNPEGLLLPGMTATVRIAVAEVGPVLKVPLAALRFTPDGGGAGKSLADEGGQSVWILDQNGNPRPRKVFLGPDDGLNIAILDGELSQGESVITGNSPSVEEFQLLGIKF